MPSGDAKISSCLPTDVSPPNDLMAIPIVCASCATKLRAPNNIAGQKTKCPKCGGVVTVPNPSAELLDASVPQPVPQPTKSAEPTAVRPKSSPKAVDGDKDNGAKDYRDAPRKKKTRKRVSAALLVGGGVGLLLIVAASIWLMVLLGVGSTADNTAAKQNAASDADKAPLPAPKSIEPQGADASMAALQQGDLRMRLVSQQGDVRVRLASAGVDFIKGKDFRNFTSNEKFLKIALVVENTRPNRNITYQGWGASYAFRDDDGPRLTDNFGNTYKRINFGLGSRIDGQVLSGSIDPGKAITDLLIFEVPVATIEYLQLELPAKNFEGMGTLELQIPKTMIQH